MVMNMKGITCCADCAYYNTKKHKCTRAVDEGKPTDHFYADCPLPTVTNAQGWISVKDRLPTPDEDVLTLDSQGNYYIDFVFDGSWWDAKSEWNPVKWWMPLPEPPKEDDGE